MFQGECPSSMQNYTSTHHAPYASEKRGFREVEGSTWVNPGVCLIFPRCPCKGLVELYDLLSKLLVSPLISPIVVP